MIHLLPSPPRVRASQLLPPAHVLFAVVVFSLLGVAATWPLLPRLATQLAGDLGDPLFVTWVMTWVMSHMSRAAGGDMGSLDRLWNANIFYPEPNTLAFSEHFVAQSLQMLPLWSVTGNPLLAYNAAWLLTFVLTGTATFLLTRALVGGLVGPLLAGAVAAVNPYRLEVERAHLQVLSVQWLPFAMWAMHEYVKTGSRLVLFGLSVCLIALNLSSAYLMLFCAPVLLLFAVGEMGIAGRWREWPRWGGLAVAAACAALVTWPFVLPYLEVNRALAFGRTLAEAEAYSATPARYAKFVLPWAHIPIAFAGLALAIRHPQGPAGARARSLLIAGLLVLTVLLSFGPVMAFASMPGPYALLYHYVPGFGGLRVVYRYAAIALVLLAVLAGAGATALCRRTRLGGPVALLATAAFLWQVWPGALPTNVPVPSAALRPAPAYLTPAPSLPPIYQAVAGLDPAAVLVEFPFGDLGYETRYLYFSGFHQRRLFNGYSGFFPPSYVARQRVFAEPLARPAAVMDALAGATHVVVHTTAWHDDTGARLLQLLEENGAQLISETDGAVLLALDPLERYAKGLRD